MGTGEDSPRKSASVTHDLSSSRAPGNSNLNSRADREPWSNGVSEVLRPPRRGSPRPLLFMPRIIRI